LDSTWELVESNQTPGVAQYISITDKISQSGRMKLLHLGVNATEEHLLVSALERA
jgi:hypothetical protein